MSLTVALNTATQSLSTVGVQTSTVSRNNSGANDADFSRKNALLATQPGGGVYVASIGRAADSALFNKLLAATSSSSMQSALLTGLEKLSGATVDDPEKDQSVSAKVSALLSSLEQYSASPDDATLAQAVVTKALAVVDTLNSDTTTVQGLREQADADMATSVSTINTLLGKFQEVNTTIVKGTIAGADITDYLDTRDSILKQLSEQLGIRTANGPNNSMSIYTDSGVTLFDVVPRSVTFAATQNYTPATVGNAVIIDGVPVTGANAVMPLQSGKLVGLSQLRDSVTTTYQDQLDEVARGLITIFSESDQTVPPTLPNVTGLFTYSGTAIPAAATVVTGLAGLIKVNPVADPAQGGNAKLIRDGGMNGAAYVYNTTSAAGFTGRIQQLVNSMTGLTAFDPAAQTSTSASIVNFAASSTSWLEAKRSSASADSDYQSTLLDRSTQALSNVKGVNTDDEMAKMLDLERSYSASAKLISTVDQMLQSLLSAVGRTL
jgi:flagellar hook-associated protein 1 FlgK